jgi:hypothetical protein
VGILRLADCFGGQLWFGLVLETDIEVRGAIQWQVVGVVVNAAGVLEDHAYGGWGELLP